MSITVLILAFGLVALAASAFVVVPVLRSSASASRRPLLAALTGLGVIGVGCGTYAILGQPGVALSSLGTPGPTDYPGLVATLARRMPDRPGDLEGWTLLARGYGALGMPDQAAKAYER